LKELVAQWQPTQPEPTHPVRQRQVTAVLSREEGQLTEILHGCSSRRADASWSDSGGLGTPNPSALEAVSARLIQDLLRHSHAGCGSLQKLYPATIEWWRALHPDDKDLAELSSSFGASKARQRYVELAVGGTGICIEHAFYSFCVEAGIGDAAVLEEEFLAAMMRAFATSPRPAFELPNQLKRGPNGVMAISCQRIVHAVSEGRIIRGRLPSGTNGMNV
jgi:hypothetical protein